MYRPAGWVILLLGAAVAGIGYLGFVRYPASLSAIPFLEKLLPFLAEGWREQRDLYASIFDSTFGVFVRGHPMELAGGYGLIGLLLLLSREYRDAGWENCLLVLWYGIFIPILFFIGLIVAQWGFDIFHSFSRESMSTKVARMHTDPTGYLVDLVGSLVIGIPAILIGLVIGLVIHAAVYVVPPLYLLFALFTLPSILFVIVRFLVRLPVLAYHYVHYLSVPHPAETAYRTGVANDLPMEELASVVADAMYVYDHGDLDALPPAWKSRNQTKRAEAFKDLVDAEGPLMEAIMANLEIKDKLRERRTTDA